MCMNVVRVDFVEHFVSLILDVNIVNMTNDVIIYGLRDRKLCAHS